MPTTRDDHGTPSYLTFLMQVTFNTSGSIILMPWTFATLGYVFGPIVMVVFFAITLWAQYFLNRAAIDGSVTARTLKDLAVCIGGRRFGLFAAALQAANMLLVMPAELDIASTALQYVVNARPGSLAHCNIMYVLAMAVPAVLGTQLVRRLGRKTGALAGLSFAVIIVKSGLIVYGILRSADLYPSDAAPMAAPASWANVVSALGNFLWIFAPVFLNTELAAEMRQPEHVHRQLLLAAACVTALYTTVGVAGAAAWGASARDPINLQLPHDWLGVAVNCLLCYSAWLDYLLSQIVFTAYVQEAIEPGFDAEDFSPSACGRWLLYSLPANVTALALISFVPQLETLVGVVTAATVTLASLTLPALAGLHWGRREQQDVEKSMPPEAGEEASQSTASSAASAEPEPADGRLLPALEVRTGLELSQWLLACWGVLAMLALAASSVYFVATAEYSSGNYFCDIVG